VPDFDWIFGLRGVEILVLKLVAGGSAVVCGSRLSAVQRHGMLEIRGSCGRYGKDKSLSLARF
jgi:hypothetical protein